MSEKKPILKISSPFEDCAPDADGVLEVDSKSEWEKLKRIAHASYPEKLINQATDGLNPRQRLAAFAHVLKWEDAKIAKESNLKIDTIRKWLRDPRVLNFMDAIRFQRGEKDVKDYYKAQAFTAARMLVDVMNNEALGIQVRVKAADRIVEMGLDKEVVKTAGESKAITLKDMMTQLQKGKTIEIEDVTDSKSDNHKN